MFIDLLPKMLNFRALFILCLLYLAVEFVVCEEDDTVYKPIPVDLKSDDYKNKLFCDFEAKNCSWKASGIWKWHHGRSLGIQLDGPPDKERFRKYRSLLADFYTKKGSKVEKEYLTSPVIQPTASGTMCLTFNFYTFLAETKNDGITLFLVDPDNEKDITAIWSHGNSGIDSWLPAKVNIATKKPFKLSFEAYGKHGYIAVENFQMDDQVCKTNKIDFESGNDLPTGWTSDSNPPGKEFRVIHAGKSAFKNPIDHTTHSSFGHFAYSEGAEGFHVQARLVSPEMEGLEQQCVAFAFMRTSNEIELKLLRKLSAKDTYESLWESNRTHRYGQWHIVQQEIRILDAMKLVFQADYSKSSEDNQAIAIDDFAMKPFNCEDIIRCTWSRNLCGWEPNRDFNLQWSLGSGRVENSSKLRDMSEIKHLDIALYSDFTTIQDGDNQTMELLSPPMLSPFQYGKEHGHDIGNCILILYKVLTLGPNDDFTVTQIDSTDNRRVLFSYRKVRGEASRGGFAEDRIFVPNAPDDGPYRVTLTVTASDPSTRVGLKDFQFFKGSVGCVKAANYPTKTPTLF